MTKLKKSTVPKGYNWTIESTNDIKPFDPKSLQLHLEPEQIDDYIKGEVLVERMKGKGLSANVLDYLLAHPESIPEDWKGKWVYFWGTIYRNADGYLYVRFLCWRGVGWGWDYFWLGSAFGGRSPAAVSASISPKSSDTKPSVSLDFSSLEARVTAIEKWIKGVKDQLL
jgi:hypothetical protein